MKSSKIYVCLFFSFWVLNLGLLAQPKVPGLELNLLELKNLEKGKYKVKDWPMADNELLFKVKKGKMRPIWIREKPRGKKIRLRPTSPAAPTSNCFTNQEVNCYRAFGAFSFTICHCGGFVWNPPNPLD